MSNISLILLSLTCVVWGCVLDLSVFDLCVCLTNEYSRTVAGKSVLEMAFK